MVPAVVVGTGGCPPVEPPGSLLPERHGALVRNLSRELANAQAEPSLQAARQELAEANSALLEAEANFKERTEGLACGGRASMDSAARRAALARVEAELAQAREALAAAERAQQEGGVNAQQELFRTFSRMEQLKRCAERERRGLCLADGLAELQTRRQESRVRAEEARARLSSVGQAAEALAEEFRSGCAQALLLARPLVAVRGPEPELRMANAIARVDELVTAEWCVLVPCAAGGLLSVDLDALLAALGLGAGEGEEQALKALEAEEEEVEDVLLCLEPLPAPEHSATTPAPAAEGAGGERTGEGAAALAEASAAGARAAPARGCRCFARVAVDVVAEIRELAGKAPEKPRGLHLLQAWLGLLPQVRVQPAVAAALERSLRPCDVPLPKGLAAQLRPYQTFGFNWLAANARNGLGCILADDMGLGKTLQTVAFLLHMREEGLLSRPALVVTPLSVLGNWEAELARWAPSLGSRVYHGPGRALPRSCLPGPGPEEVAADGGAAVVLTTYAIVLRDAEALCSGPRFGAMVLDEGQTVKNARSQVSKAVRRVATVAVGPMRVVLSGTPVENRLAELHSLLGFALPGLLGTASAFEAAFARPLERGCSADAAHPPVPLPPERGRSGDLAPLLERGRSGDSVPSPLERGRSGDLVPLPLERQRSGDPAPPPLERGRSGSLAPPPLESGRSGDLARLRVLTRLQNAIRPFILRRTKMDPSIAADLPPKIDLEHTVELTAGQRRLYAAVRSAALAAVEALAGGGGGAATAAEGGAAASAGASGGSEAAADAEAGVDVDESTLGNEVAGSGGCGGATWKRRAPWGCLALLHCLQQACNHPAAVGAAQWPPELDRHAEAFGPAASNSGKVLRLLELLEEIFEAGEKVLIFTQYLGTLGVLEAAISEVWPDMEVLKIMGCLAREQRDQVVRRFQEEAECRAFLCTLGAGGVGLNLTAATHVVHFDRCWNPARETQATDRAHRIGQLRTVVVHRLVSRGTLEERIAAVLARKAALANEAVPAQGLGSAVSECSLEELREILSFGEGIAGPEAVEDSAGGAGGSAGGA